jgi:anti-sigma factor RsiW
VETSENKTLPPCPSPDISAYIDGELSSADELRLELHLVSCRMCTEDLNLQKSFLNALDYSLDEREVIELPSNFTRAVMTNAESRVTGLRGPRERRSAALICIGLVAVAFLALGTNAERSIVAIAAVADKLVAVVSSVSHFLYDVALGSAIVLRSLATSFVFESATTVLFLLVVLILSLWLFSRLLVRFDRT